MNKIEEMKALVEKLNQYRDAYYNNAEKYCYGSSV